MNGNTMSHVILSVKGENFLNKPFLYTKSVSFFAIQRSTLSLEKNWLYGPWMYWEKFPNGLMGQGEVLDPKERKINEQYTHCSTLWSLPLKSNILTHRLFFQCVSGLHCFLWQRALGSFWSRNCPSTTRGSKPGLGSEWSASAILCRSCFLITLTGCGKPPAAAHMTASRTPPSAFSSPCTL